VTPCGSCKNRLFRGTYRLSHQGGRIQRAKNNVSTTHSILMMEAMHSSDTSVLQERYGVTSKITAFVTVTTVRSSNRTQPLPMPTNFSFLYKYSLQNRFKHVVCTHKQKYTSFARDVAAFLVSNTIYSGYNFKEGITSKF
jgi:hypothetical protein